MPPTETLTTFLIASVLLGLAPGPDNLFVVTQSAIHGRAAGLIVTLGLCTGLIVHSMAVAFGVAAIFETSAFAFTAVKFVGAAYLVCLAWQAFRSSESEMPEAQSEAKTHGKLYLRGALMNLTNPKVSIFFLAFLPQFADPASGSVTVQLLLLGGMFMLSTVVVFGSIAFAAGTIRKKVAQSAGIQIWLNRIAGAVFVGLALKLATAKR